MWCVRVCESVTMRVSVGESERECVCVRVQSERVCVCERVCRRGDGVHVVGRQFRPSTDFAQIGRGEGEDEGGGVLVGRPQ